MKTKNEKRRWNYKKRYEIAEDTDSMNKILKEQEKLNIFLKKISKKSTPKLVELTKDENESGDKKK